LSALSASWSPSSCVVSSWGWSYRATYRDKTSIKNASSASSSPQSLTSNL
jgi:hypothetical protein